MCLFISACVYCIGLFIQGQPPGCPICQDIYTSSEIIKCFNNYLETFLSHRKVVLPLPLGCQTYKHWLVYAYLF